MDPALVVAWTDKALADQRAAQAELTALPNNTPTGKPDVRALLTSLGDIPTLLATADTADKAELYDLLAISLVWDPIERTPVCQALVRHLQ